MTGIIPQSQPIVAANGLIPLQGGLPSGVTPVIPLSQVPPQPQPQPAPIVPLPQQPTAGLQTNTAGFGFQQTQGMPQVQQPVGLPQPQMQAPLPQPQLLATGSDNFQAPPLRTASTSDGFGNSPTSTQAPQFSNIHQQLAQQPQQIQPTQTGRGNLKRTSVNPFSISTIPEQGEIAPQATNNPFSNTRFGAGSTTTALSFEQNNSSQPKPLESTLTGTNPFTSAQPTLAQQQASKQQQQMGNGALISQPTAGGLENLPTVPVFPETIQQQHQSQLLQNAGAQLQQAKMVNTLTGGGNPFGQANGFAQLPQQQQQQQLLQQQQTLQQMSQTGGTTMTLQTNTTGFNPFGQQPAQIQQQPQQLQQNTTGTHRLSIYNPFNKQVTGGLQPVGGAGIGQMTTGFQQMNLNGTNPGLAQQTTGFNPFTGGAPPLSQMAQQQVQVAQQQQPVQQFSGVYNGPSLI
ncbi:unnamed protein product [Ambrosiozyma monospora]|uniref:Unnamed protein product n=1 Tax=Ambrosiozyma monospora TaxID=43982 RepID=A0ACB5T3A3_AMBMO|nr:unnamed protein product [Ambrosiozyma monospora]